MGDDITDVLWAAWTRVRETLRGRPEEVRRRMLRGREQWRKHPPRAWCLVIRARDRRITAGNAATVPEYGPAERVEHTVTLDIEFIRELCAPVRLHAWGESPAEAAQKLGRDKTALQSVRVRGVLASRYHPPGGGRGGPQRPTLSAAGWLDPNQSLCRPADPVWGWTGKLVRWRVPDELPPQTLRRVPLWEDRTRRYADPSTLHPEHPLRQTPTSKRTQYKLPPPPPDHMAWYKWKDGKYLGYDWRNPAAKAGYERYQRHLAYDRERHRKNAAVRNAKRRAKRGGVGSKLFKGWMWLCPTCGKRAKILYYPLPPINVLRGYGGYVPDDVIEAAEALDPSLRKPLRHAGGFACNACIHVRSISRVRVGCWGECVTLLSGGLLYGRDVPKPSWFTPDRRRAYKPHLMPPSKRRPQVEAMLLDEGTFRQIAAKLDVKPNTIATHATAIYRTHGVRNRDELRRKLRPQMAAIRSA